MLFISYIILHFISFSAVTFYVNTAAIMVPLMSETPGVADSSALPQTAQEQTHICSTETLTYYREVDRDADVIPASYYSCLSLVDQLRGAPLVNVPEGEDRVCDGSQTDSSLRCCVGWTNADIEGVRYGDLIIPVAVVLRDAVVSHNFRYDDSGDIFDHYGLARQCTKIWVGSSKR